MFKITFKTILYISIYSLLNTILSFGIIYIINNALAGNADFLKDYIAMVFALLVIYSYLINIIFQKQLYKFTYHILYREEKKLFGKILENEIAKKQDDLKVAHVACWEGIIMTIIF